MPYRFLADLVLLVHLGFILFVVAGGFLVLRWPRLAWLHLPVAAWGFAISVFRWTCPLTPLENWLRRGAGQAGYDGTFIDHYLTPLIYPRGLTPATSWAIAAGVLAINVAVYALLRRRSRVDGEPGGRAR